MPRIPKWIIIAFVCVAFAGFLDASYLTIEHYTQGVVPCYLFGGCEKVTTSIYATVLSVPVSLIGAVYYFVIFIAGMIFLDSGYKKSLDVLGYFPMAGLAATIYFVSLQLFVIKALCFYCIVSAIFSTILFVLGLRILRLKKAVFS